MGIAVGSGSGVISIQQMSSISNRILVVPETSRRLLGVP